MGEYEDLLQEYEQLKKEKINLLERAGDFFSGIDERIDFLVPKTLEALVGTREALIEIKRVKAAIAQLPGVEVIMPGKIEQIPYSYNLAPLQGVMLSEYAPFSGYIKGICSHWPDGCDARVDVRVGHGIKQFCPNEGYLALNDTTTTYPFNEWVDDHEEIWVEMMNGDSDNPHNITVTVILEGVA